MESNRDKYKGMRAATDEVQANHLTPQEAEKNSKCHLLTTDNSVEKEEKTIVCVLRKIAPKNTLQDYMTYTVQYTISGPVLDGTTLIWVNVSLLYKKTQPFVMYCLPPVMCYKLPHGWLIA